MNQGGRQKTGPASGLSSVRKPDAKRLRAAVIGGSGQLGSWLLWTLAQRGHDAIGTYASVTYPGLVPLDAGTLDSAARWVAEQKADVVFYPAGFTWVDGCERDPARAYAANLEQPLNVARAAAAVGARFVYFSTDYVFDGHNGPYSEDSPTRPLSVYGRAKRDAELALESELGAAQLTIRTAWVYGPERQGKNFAYQLLRTLGEKKPVVCPSDQVSSPSYGPDVAQAAVLLAEAGAGGLIHAVGPETIDRVQFARAIATAFGYNANMIAGRATADLGQGAPRPLNGGLKTPRLDTAHPATMRSLDAALEHFRAALCDPQFRSWILPVPESPGGDAPNKSQGAAVWG
jgi:dTDP-4-dehydrorhamnose reductase